MCFLVFHSSDSEFGCFSVWTGQLLSIRPLSAERLFVLAKLKLTAQTVIGWIHFCCIQIMSLQRVYYNFN